METEPDQKKDDKTEKKSSTKTSSPRKRAELEKKQQDNADTK